VCVRERERRGGGPLVDVDVRASLLVGVCGMCVREREMERKRERARARLREW